MTAAATQLEHFFDEARQVYAAAARAASKAEACDYELAGQALRVHYASGALAASLSPALAHLPAPAAEPRLNVYVWGGDMPAGQLPPPPWESLSYYERGNVRGWQTERFTLAYDRRPEVFSAIDTERQVAIYWVREAAALPYYERSAPLRHVLQGWLQCRGLFVAHAAAVGSPGARPSGALLAGGTGAGKSTTALACARRGLAFAGDDFVLLAAEPRPYVYCLYNSAKLNPGALDWLPETAPLVTNREQLAHEKALLYLTPAWAPRVSAGMPLSVVLLPHPTTERTSAARPIRPEAAFKAIAPDTLFRALGPARLAAGALSRLVHGLPCYRLELGQDLDGVVEVIASLLARYAA